VDLIAISEALHDGRTVTLTLSANHGSVLLSTSVRGGLATAQVAGNGTHAVTITAPVGTINTTLHYPGGLLYRGDPNFIGSDTLAAALHGGPGIEATGAITITVVGAAMESWLMAQFSAADLADPAREATIWGPKADPDSDGLDNLMEYALGLIPTSGQDAGQGVTSAIMQFETSRACS